MGEGGGRNITLYPHLRSFKPLPQSQDMLSIIKTTAGLTTPGETIVRVNATHGARVVAARWLVADPTVTLPSSLPTLTGFADRTSYAQAMAVIRSVEKFVSSTATLSSDKEGPAVPQEVRDVNALLSLSAAGGMASRPTRISVLRQRERDESASAAYGFTREEARNFIAWLNARFTVHMAGDLTPVTPTSGGTLVNTFIRDSVARMDLMSSYRGVMGSNSEATDADDVLSLLTNVAILNDLGVVLTVGYGAEDSMLSSFVSPNAMKDKRVMALGRVLRLAYMLAAFALPRHLFAIRALDKAMAVPGVKKLWLETATPSAIAEYERDTAVLSGLPVPHVFSAAARYFNPYTANTPWGKLPVFPVCDTLYDELLGGDDKEGPRESRFSDLAITRHPSRRLRVQEATNAGSATAFGALLAARHALAQIMAPMSGTRKNLLLSTYQEVGQIAGWRPFTDESANRSEAVFEEPMTSDGAYSSHPVTDTFEIPLRMLAPAGVTFGAPALIEIGPSSNLTPSALDELEPTDIIDIPPSDRGVGKWDTRASQWATPILWSTNAASRPATPLALSVSPTDYELATELVKLRTGGVVGAPDYVQVENSVSAWAQRIGQTAEFVVQSIATRPDLWSHLFDEEGAPRGPIAITSTSTRARRRGATVALPPMGPRWLILTSDGHITEAWDRGRSIFTRTPVLPVLEYLMDSASSADISLLGIRAGDWEAGAPARDQQ